MKFIIKNFKEVLLNKKDFFKKLKREKSVNKSLIYYLVLTIIVFLLVTYTYTEQINNLFSMLYVYTGISYFNIELQVNFQTYFLLALLFIISNIISSLFRYWLVHLSVRIFKKVKYRDTYNSLFYSVTPGYVAWVFLALFVLLSPFNFYLALIPFLFFIGFEIYTIYIRSKGLAHVHNISFFKSFLCMYVISVLFSIILLLILFSPLLLFI